MKAALLTAYEEPLVVEEVEPVPPGPRDVVVRMTASAFCYTDCLNQRGVRGLPRALPTILGHSAVGVVTRVGAEVTRFAEGDRVLVPGTPECGACYWCVRGRSDQCEVLFRPPGPVAHRASGEPVTVALGTYAEEIRVPDSWVFPLESRLGDDVLSMLGCGIMSGLGAVFNVARVEPGSSVAVVGCGHLGQWMVQGAKVAGAATIVAVEPLAGRRETARLLGATAVVDPGEGDPVEQVRDLTEGRGADYVLEAAGSPEAQEQAFVMARRAGTVVFTGIRSQSTTITLSQPEVALRGRTLISCQMGRSSARRDVPRYVAMLEAGVVDATPILTRTYPLERIQDAVERSCAREDLTGVIVP
jgi:S-(hydroxymethyl)glutathione dehydrogenase/alcohol dehydrogenase